jgi:hypothetical protein
MLKLLFGAAVGFAGVWFFTRDAGTHGREGVDVSGTLEDDVTQTSGPAAEERTPAEVPPVEAPPVEAPPAEEVAPGGPESWLRPRR